MKTTTVPFLRATSSGAFGGLAWPETDVAHTGRDMLSQYSSPVRVVAFNTTEGWSRDVSDEIAAITRACADRDEILPSIPDFIAEHAR